MPALGPAASNAQHRLEHVEDIGSTNDTLFNRAREGGDVSTPLWLVADRQLSGKGRNARAWDSPPGNLYASLLLANPAPLANLAELSFVLAIALRDAVLAAAHLHDDQALRLKWPNDLMHDGAKTAGLLLEGGQGPQGPFAVAGFGVNIVSHPSGTQHPATDLAASGYRVDRDQVLACLSDAVTHRLHQWNRGQGFPALRQLWLNTAFGLGGPIRITTLSETFSGTFKTIDPAGRLVVTTETGDRVVSAGDVFALKRTPEGAAA